MSRSVMLIPVAKAQGIFPATLGLAQALTDKGAKAEVFRPIYGCCEKTCSKYSVPLSEAVKLLGQGKRSELLETILANFKRFESETGAKVAVVEGTEFNLLDRDALNAEICHALDADLLTVTPGDCARATAFTNISLSSYGNAGKDRVLGAVVLNDDAPLDSAGNPRLVLSGCAHCGSSCAPRPACSTSKADALQNVVARIAFDPDNYALRASEIAAALNAKVTSGDPARRGHRVDFDAATAKQKSVLVTSSVPASTEAGIVVLCDGAEGTVGDATVICTKDSVWNVAKALADVPAVLGADDTERAGHAADTAKGAFDAALIEKLAGPCERFPLMSPAAFRLKLTELARAAHKRIALPEGDEPRTVAAAAIVAAQNIAVPVLFGKKDKILAVAKEQGVTLGEGVEFVDPEEIRMNYVDRLVELRQKKGMTREGAIEMLQDNVALATMMIERNEVDGLVSGAVHTTANTIRPPLQIIKTAPGAKLVSAIFFMLMPEQVYVYGDCALCIKPTADELSEIAIQSADTAKAFGIDPKVAMVTYSTMNSGKGEDVDLMKEATRLVREKRPDIAVDGPLQYDAAVMPNVAAQKAPGSPVAGKATVFIFPTLSTGNTVYKAVQRSAGLVSIGPMLQGMRRPVNDLSRGALVDDIVYTVAVTAIQATQC